MIARRVFFAGCVGLLSLIAGCKKSAPVEFIQLGTPRPPLQKYWTIPDFTLTERNGAAVGMADLKGKVWVADFFFTSCPGPCKTLSARLSRVQQEFGKDDRLRLVSISGDPETDTPEVLQEYAAHFEAGDRWFFLTGDRATIHKLAREGFKLPIAADLNTPGLIAHSTRFVLVDRNGTARGFYEGAADDDASVNELLTDLRALLKE